MKKKIVILLVLSIIISTCSPGIRAYALENQGSNSSTIQNEQSNVMVTEGCIFIDGKKLSETEFVNLIYEEGIPYNKGELDNSNLGLYNISSAGELAPYLGWTIFVPDLGEIVLTAAGIMIGGYIVYQVGSLAWNKVIKFINQDNNLTADEYIGKHCKGSIRREFPSEFLNKTIKEIEREAKKGNARARKALKLLKDGRFRK